ncbi:BBE domain-containing protein [Streptomyces sp. NBC_01198]|uniref:BBE domain-containing protein n=1 Tax=Streptomyces sp. NBC_01198 TaxID=2903769 RepID=UPI002E129C0D|nr:BBE domain-containing protein [Streptomyces sp. NBC_01198]
MLSEVTEETFEAIVELAGPEADVPVEFFELRHLGGAFGRQVGPAGAVGNRDARFAVWILSMGPPAEGDPATAYAEGALARLQPWSTGHTYLNFTSSGSTPVRVEEGYTYQAYERLRAVKSVYDPQNVFRLNENIPPIGTA